jgi:hypothetical protein
MGGETIEIARYPDLQLLAWQPHRTHIGEAEAFAIYEREWRYLDLRAKGVRPPFTLPCR